MIVSVSRRADIPAFYSRWFINRVRAGFCTVPNPFNARQVSVVSLHPEDVVAFVFWTRNPRPLWPFLRELDDRGFHYYFQYTLIGNPQDIDPDSPSLENALRTFSDLADRVGPDRVIWRYDPIVVSEITPVAYHRRNYSQIARRLRGQTKRSVVSFLDSYKKTRARLATLAARGIHLRTREDLSVAELGSLVKTMAEAAAENSMQITSCAEKPGLSEYGISPGKCVDDELIARLFGRHVTAGKDPAQRPACGCVVSRDIGMYDACLFGCAYCYAVSSFARARANHATHDPASPSLLGWYEASPTGQAATYQPPISATDPPS